MGEISNEFSIHVHDYKVGDKAIPQSLQTAWYEVEKEIRDDMRILAYEHDELHEIRFSAPNILACPNSEQGLERVLEDVKQSRKEMFKELGIIDNKSLQLAFILYHEYKHLLQNKEGRLKAFQAHNEAQLLEEEADEFAKQKVKGRLGNT